MAVAFARCRSAPCAPRAPDLCRWDTVRAQRCGSLFATRPAHHHPTGHHHFIRYYLQHLSTALARHHPHWLRGPGPGLDHGFGRPYWPTSQSRHVAFAARTHGRECFHRYPLCSTPFWRLVQPALPPAKPLGKPSRMWVWLAVSPL